MEMVLLQILLPRSPRSPLSVDDVNVTVEAIQRQTGLAVLQRGPCYAYIDSLHQLGAVVEVAKQC